MKERNRNPMRKTKLVMRNGWSFQAHPKGAGGRGNTSKLLHDVMATLAGLLLPTPTCSVFHSHTTLSSRVNQRLWRPSATSIIQAVNLMPSTAINAMAIHDDPHAFHPQLERQCALCQ